MGETAHVSGERHFDVFVCLFLFSFFFISKDRKTSIVTVKLNAELCKSYYELILFHFLVHVDDA